MKPPPERDMNNKMNVIMPTPRLQLRWAKDEDYQLGNWLCHYELVLPLQDGDVRREVYNDDREITGHINEFVVPIVKPTRRTSSATPCTSYWDGSRFRDTPMRDGKHAEWDAAALGGLPVYVIAPDGMVFPAPARSESR